MCVVLLPPAAAAAWQANRAHTYLGKRESEWHDTQDEADIYPDFVLMAKSFGVPGEHRQAPAAMPRLLLCCAASAWHQVTCGGICLMRLAAVIVQCMCVVLQRTDGGCCCRCCPARQARDQEG
eukprot:GHRQ01033303.1.p1 GENE.GHRQ01033303.1~~GHRQ01033303.1.p1  ORF type:complete len:123 (-),score=30.87 GHRQ01033303.1:527-895(-)